MSIIDTNVFYGKWPFRNAGFDDMDRIRAVCDKNGVTGMLVASVQSIFYEDPFEAELELHRQLAGRTDARQVYTVNPPWPPAGGRTWMPPRGISASQLSKSIPAIIPTASRARRLAGCARRRGSTACR